MAALIYITAATYLMAKNNMVHKKINKVHLSQICLNIYLDITHMYHKGLQQKHKTSVTKIISNFKDPKIINYVYHK